VPFRSGVYPVETMPVRAVVTQVVASRQREERESSPRRGERTKRGRSRGSPGGDLDRHASERR
jgi:hypothetical protein